VVERKRNKWEKQMSQGQLTYMNTGW
jgi:hypothetical protein